MGARELEGKRALVTGASRGIGRAVARAYAAAGAEVVLVARDGAALDEVARGIVAANGRAHGLAADLADPAGVAAAARATLARWPDRLDVLVHAAGLFGGRATIEHTPTDTWTRVLGVNLTAGFVLVRELLPALRASGAGSIVLVSSGLGRHGAAELGAYCVSKFGLEGLAQVLAAELAGSPVRVNVVLPGRVRTSMHAEAFPHWDPATLASAESVASAFVHLASDASRGVHGEALDARSGRRVQ